MPRTCTICRHPQRDAIDAALVSGETIRPLAHRFAISPDALKRHKAHISRGIERARDAAVVTRWEGIEAYLQEVLDDLRRVVGKAERAGDFRAVVAASAQRVKIGALLGEVHGEIGPRARALENVDTLDQLPLKEQLSLVECARAEILRRLDAAER